MSQVCQTCRWWHAGDGAPPAPGAWGLCFLARWPEARPARQFRMVAFANGVTHAESAHLATAPDFVCAEWEARD
jgi:hypothetical protein